MRSVLPGTVIFVAHSGRWERYGNTVIVDHGRTLGFPLVSLSAHLSLITVSQGDKVTTGAAIGHVGRTAGLRADPGALMAQSAAHLHLEFFEVKGSTWSLNSARVDASEVLRALGIAAPPGQAMYSACGQSVPAYPAWAKWRPAFPPKRAPAPSSPTPAPAPSSAERAGHSAGFASALVVLGLLAWWWQHD